MRTQQRIQLTRKISTRFHCLFGQREVRLHATAISRTVTNSSWKNVVVLSISKWKKAKRFGEKSVSGPKIERISLVLSRRQIYLVSGISRLHKIGGPLENTVILIGRQRKARRHVIRSCYVLRSLFHLIPRHVSSVYSISSGAASARRGAGGRYFLGK